MSAGLWHDLRMRQASSPCGPALPEPNDLQRAFDAAIQADLTAKGWQPSRDNYLLSLSPDFDVWLGFNMTLDLGRIEVGPAIGVCYRPLQNLLAEHLTELHRGNPTLGSWIATLTPSFDAGVVAVDSIADASRASAAVVDLVEQYGLPYTRQYDSAASVLEAISDPRKSMAEWQRFRLAAMHFLVDDLDTARTLVTEDLGDLSGSPHQALIAAYHRLADAISARRNA